MEWKAPRSIEQYKKSPEKLPNTSGVIKAGTTISIVGLRDYEPSAWKVTKTYVLGKITEGEKVGQVVNLYDLTLDAPKGQRTGVRIPYPDLKLIRRVVQGAELNR